jgi:hypothetical protein
MKTKKPNDTATLENLFSDRNRIKSEHDQRKIALECEIQLVLNKKFDANKNLQKAIKTLGNKPTGYMINEYSDVQSWLRFDFSDFPPIERDFLENYLFDRCMAADFANDCLLQNHGNDNYIIQDNCGRNNGVYQGHRQVFSVDQYTDENGEISVKTRNELIENRMQKNGCFPGVFRLVDSRSNDLMPVNTLPRKKSKKGSK